MSFFTTLLCYPFIGVLVLGPMFPPEPSLQPGLTIRQAERPGEVRRFAGIEDKVLSLGFTPDGRYIAAGGGDGIVRLWETASAKEIRKFGANGLEVFQFKELGFSKDGRRIFATGEFDLLFRSWDRQTGRQFMNFKEPGERILDAVEAAILPASLITDEKDEFAKAGMAEGLCMIHMAFRPWYRSMLAVSNDGRRGVSLTALMAMASREKIRKIIVRVWNLENGKELHRFEGKVAFDWQAFLQWLHADSDWLLCLVAWIQSYSDSTLIDFISRSADAPVDSLALGRWKLSPDGSLIYCGCDDGYLRIWEIKTGKLIRRFPQEPSIIHALDLSPDGRLALMATTCVQKDGTYDYLLQLWNVEIGKLVYTMKSHEKSINCIAFSPDGRRILSGGEDRTVRLWDVASGRLIHSFPGHTNTINAVAFSPDGKYALSGGDGNNDTRDPIRLWRLPE